MFKIALIGTLSAVLLLVAGSIAFAGGTGMTNGGYGHTLDAANQVGRMSSAATTTSDGTATMPGASETMESHITRAANQMRIHAAQVEASTHMQTATGLDPGSGMQYDNMGTGSGYMDPDNMGTGTGYMGPDNMGYSSNTGTTGTGGYQMGTTGTGTASGSGSTMMGASGSRTSGSGMMGR